MPPRFAPHLPLPPYTYIPGRAPHPLRDPTGHSYGKHPSPSPPLDDTNWQQHAAYLAGIDLFNLGYYWEAHEAWESAWHGVGRIGTTADVLKALIHLAAAGVKLREGRPQGVASHLQKALGLFAVVRAAQERCLGLTLDTLKTEVERTAAAALPLFNAPPSVVRPLFPFALEPIAEACGPAT